MAVKVQLETIKKVDASFHDAKGVIIASHPDLVHGTDTPRAT